MKIIDLLNKMANGEKVSDFIINEQKYFVGDDGYLKERIGFDVRWKIDTEWLNEEVEIIEEEKEIEEVNFITEHDSFTSFDQYKLQDKINELIRAVNELKRDK